MPHKGTEFGKNFSVKLPSIPHIDSRQGVCRDIVLGGNPLGNDTCIKLTQQLKNFSKLLLDVGFGGELFT